MGLTSLFGFREQSAHPSCHITSPLSESAQFPLLFKPDPFVLPKMPYLLDETSGK